MSGEFEYDGRKFERVLPGEYVRINFPTDEYGYNSITTSGGFVIPSGAVGIVFSLDEDEAVYSLAIYLDPKRLDETHIIGAYLPAEYITRLSESEFEDLNPKVTIPLWHEYIREEGL